MRNFPAFVNRNGIMDQNPPDSPGAGRGPLAYDRGFA
jgi:hypothetical protein